MKQGIIGALFLFFLVISFGNARAAESFLYLPLDHLQVPNPGPGWNVTFGEGRTRIEFTQASGAGMHPGLIKSVVRLIREPLPPGLMKQPAVWQREVRKELGKNYDGIKTEKLENTLYQADYAYTEDLIPVKGSRLYYVTRNWLYEWQCELEKELGRDPEEWCLEEFRKIRWPDSLPLPVAENSIPNFEELAKNLPLDFSSLQKLGSALLSSLQDGSLTLTQLHRYGSYLLVKTLLIPPSSDPEKKAVLLENLTRLADTLAPFPQSKAMAAWLRAHRDYLEGKLTYERLEEMVQVDERPPFWLLSLWVAPVNTETAVYLARRQRATRPLHHYVLGRVLADSGRVQEGIPHLVKSAKQRNTLAMNALARAYLDNRQTDRARKTVKLSLKKDPDNIDSWLLLALVLSLREGDDESGAESSEQIYDQVLTRGDLSPDERVRVYLQRAKTTLNPMARLASYEEVLKIDPNDLESLYAVGRLQLLERNDKEKGLEFFERYLDTAPPEDKRLVELNRMVRDLRVEIHGYYWNAPDNVSDHDREFGR